MLVCCYLHNYLSERKGESYRDGIADIEDFSTDQYLNGFWRSDQIQLTSFQATQIRNPTKNAKEIRTSFCTYFNTVDDVPWQYKNVKNKL